MSNKNFINSIEIKNFKSIEYLKLDAKKINIFIGEPNVGKSNILEALGLLSALGHQKLVREFVRFKNLENLFYKGSLDREVKITTKRGKRTVKLDLTYNDEEEFRIFINGALKGNISDTQRNDHFFETDNVDMKYGSSGFRASGNKSWSEYYNILDTDKLLRKIKYYKFRDFSPQEYMYEVPSHEIINKGERQRQIEREIYQKKQKMIKTLDPLNGKNIYDVMKNTEKSRNAFRDLLLDFELKMIINKNDKEVQIIKEEEGIYFTIPLYSLADTIQSVFFYQTAILSNENNCLVFEEPEAHTFPFYTNLLGEMIADDTSNQFFIATHNPYFLNAVFSKALSDNLQINIVRMENGRTVVYPLKSKQLDKLFDDDIFMSLSHFEDWFD